MDLSDLNTFQSFPKIARLSRDVVVTEKIDGTNAHVVVTDDGVVLAASRSRFITPGDDNYGFAAWVQEHLDELQSLGPGRHYGEWWGAGIQRRYGLTEKRFSLFNVHRWARVGTDLQHGKQLYAPPCCHVVPVLYQGPFHTPTLDDILANMARVGSAAAPGFMQPEGIIVFHTASSQLFKKTILKDDERKG